jgi:hypothetical protein
MSQPELRLNFWGKVGSRQLRRNVHLFPLIRFERRGLHRRDEAVAAPRDGLNENRILRSVTEGDAEFPDGSIQALVEVDVSAVGPEAGAQLFAGNYLARVLEQGGKDLKWLILQANCQTALKKLFLSRIKLKLTKTPARTGLERRFHPVFSPRMQRSVASIAHKHPHYFFR